MPEKHESIEFILDYTPAFQEVFKAFFVQKQFYESIAEKQKMPVDPPSRDADTAHNHYLKVTYNVQLLKFALIGDQLIYSIKHNNYLSYGLAGRSLLEHVAVWRYYLVERYGKILMSAKEVEFEHFLALIEAHHRFLFGARFDWSQWLSQDFEGLDKAYLQSMQDKRNKKPPKPTSPVVPVNVLTCVEKLAAERARFGVYYDMFCDMVHPNFGSNILLAAISPAGNVAIDKSQELQLGRKLIEETFGELILLTYGQVNELTKSHFSMLFGEQPPNMLSIDLTKLETNP
jgi:hypothetical protein